MHAKRGSRNQCYLLNMFKRYLSALTPLHLAVIAGDEAAVARHANRLEWQTALDSLGLTPLALAQLLGRRACYRHLGEQLPAQFYVQFKGSAAVETCPIDTFEKQFHFTYCPFLTFSSYEILRTVAHQCPYILRSHYLAEENYAWGQLYKQAIQRGHMVDVYVKWIDERLGYGLFAATDLPAGTFVGEYTGLVRPLSRRHPDHNGYCLHYPTKWWSWHYFVVDGLHHGNLTRFINHSDQPNLQPLCTIEHRLLHQIFVTKQTVARNMQLTFDYGSDYWQKRQKQAL